MLKPSKREELSKRLTQTIWWVPSINRYGAQTGIAHAIHQGESLCGAKPFDMGASYAFAFQADCRECRRCRQIIVDVQQFRNSQ